VTKHTQNSSTLDNNGKLHNHIKTNQKHIHSSISWVTRIIDYYTEKVR